MRPVIVLTLVVALFALVFVVILRPQSHDPNQALAWQKMSQNQKRLLALSRLPWAEKPPGAEPKTEVSEDFGPIDPHAKAEKVDWHDLTSFVWKAGQGIPERLKALHGKYVRIHGQMVAMENRRSVNEFLLVPSLFEVCSGPEPTLTHYVHARLPSGTLIYHQEPVWVMGRFSVGFKESQASATSVYRMEVTELVLAEDEKEEEEYAH